MLVAEAELRLMSPYKGLAVNQLVSKTLATAPGYKKVDAVDVLYDSPKILAVWTDHQNKRVQSMALDLNEITRTSREVRINHSFTIL